MTGEEQVPPLIEAIWLGNTAKMEKLLLAGADPDVSFQKVPALSFAVMKGRQVTVRRLLEAGAKPDSAPRTATPLQRAAFEGHVGIVRTLIQAGARIDSRDAMGSTPLMNAAKGGHLEVIRILIDEGATVDLQDRQKRTALIWACSRGDFPETVSHLVHAGANAGLASKRSTPIGAAALTGRFETLKLLLAMGVNVDQVQGFDDATPLMFAAHAGHVGIVQQLLLGRASVNARDKEGWTALMHAINRSEFTIAEVLLDHGADPKVRALDGTSAVSLTTAEAPSVFVMRLKNPSLLH